MTKQSSWIATRASAAAGHFAHRAMTTQTVPLPGGLLISHLLCALCVGAPCPLWRRSERALRLATNTAPSCFGRMSTSPLRVDGRRPDQLRNITFEANIAPYATGSVLVSFGLTRVICA